MPRRPWLVLLLPLLLSACGGGSVAGLVRVDGSSTVYPITEAAAEDYMRAHPGQARITLGVSGTGGGFRKFCRGELDLLDASRAIQPGEIEACRAAGAAFVELPIALDAITVVVNPANDWLHELSVAQLRRLWEPAAEARLMRWSQLHPAFPDAPIRLFGAGADSGTFDYFTRAVMGQARASRGDYSASEDDNLLVSGVAGDPNALGYFGYAYWRENAGRVRAVPIRAEDAEAAVLPDPDSVRSGRYRPLARPVFVYVRAEALQRPEVRAFADYYLAQAPVLVEQAGFIALDADAYRLARERLQAATTGSVFAGREQSGLRIADLLRGAR